MPPDGLGSGARLASGFSAGDESNVRGTLEFALGSTLSGSVASKRLSAGVDLDSASNSRIAI